MWLQIKSFKYISKTKNKNPRHKTSLQRETNLRKQKRCSWPNHLVRIRENNCLKRTTTWCPKNLIKRKDRLKTRLATLLH